MAEILACGAIFGKNFGLRRHFWQKFRPAALFQQKFWPAALFLAKILACRVIFVKKFNRYESAFFENLLQEGYVQFLVCCAKLKRKNKQRRAQRGAQISAVMK